MAKQTPRNRRVSQSQRASQARANELRSLKASLADLESKRFSALRLYQEEKVQRQQESARADLVSSQLEKLQTAVVAHPPKLSNPTNTVTTDSFVAELRGLGLAPPIPFASLTWHCLAMADLLAGPPDVLAVLHPTAAVQETSSAVKDASTVMSIKDDALMKRRPSSLNPNGHHLPSDVSKDIANLMKRLKQLEEEAQAAKRSMYDNEHLVSDLRSQLDASTTVCKDLMLTVKEQQETIERLS